MEEYQEDIKALIPSCTMHHAKGQPYLNDNSEKILHGQFLQSSRLQRPLHLSVSIEQRTIITLQWWRICEDIVSCGLVAKDKRWGCIVCPIVKTGLNPVSEFEELCKLHRSYHGGMIAL
ncbi:hypothetical protein LOAG_01729 [Loa loa]|uniref:Uncharacterized protein n=1 Tax=Loa loa TaxID=7209 RepID=A0A1S0U916_LOALO|nr:hypothetical protein LOAG_01729 [Loa loa]EFO26753.1 hypothetical protein LOAG_01729 [Loa loa]